jgi:hypothetical protein
MLATERILAATGTPALRKGRRRHNLKGKNAKNRRNFVKSYKICQKYGCKCE